MSLKSRIRIIERLLNLLDEDIDCADIWRQHEKDGVFPESTRACEHIRAMRYLFIITEHANLDSLTFSPTIEELVDCREYLLSRYMEDERLDPIYQRHIPAELRTSKDYVDYFFNPAIEKMKEATNV